MINANNVNCTGCHGCENVCPQHCIRMEYNGEGFLFPIIEEDKCIHCNLCDKVCPILDKKEIKRSPNAFACINNNFEIRKQSSSGGLFTILAEYVISQGGIVYGAAFNSNFEVEHIAVSDLNDLSKLRCSKYVQSRLGDTYKNIKKYLDKEQLIYFSGTPCQVDGLLCFLQKKYSNLICQDIICHGVPSYKVWKKYLNEKDALYKSKPSAVNFRNKNHGWREYELTIQFENGFEYHSNHQNDLYMKAFLKNLDLRNSCYNCQNKSLERSSDITLGDFWGIDNIDKKIDDNYGVSLIIINSEIGMRLLNKIKRDLHINEVNLYDSVKYNTSAYLSVAKNKNRNKFFKLLDEQSLEELVHKFTKPSFIERLKATKYKILKHFKL